MSRPATTVRRSRRALLAVALALPVAAAPALAQEAVRTETGLGGYRINAEGAPLKVLLDDPTIPLPRPPEAAVLEADPSYTSTTLSTGPQARALASTLWPGALIGDGTGVITGGATDYPLKADATFPGGEPQVEKAGMKAVARGLDVVATAGSGAPEQEPESPLRTGNAKSRSSSTIVKDVGIGTVLSEVSDVNLLGNLISVDSVRTTMRSTSDGKKATTEGQTVVSGLVVNGVGYVVDSKGVRRVDGGKGGEPILPPLGDSPDELKEAGITIEPVGQKEEVEDAAASRTAKGLRITIDTVALRAALNELPLNEALGPVCGALPTDLQGNCFFLLSTTPKVTYILAAGSTSSAANLPIVFSFPPLAPPPLAPFLPPSVPDFVPDDVPQAADVFAAPPAFAPTDTGALPPPDEPVLAGEIAQVAAPRSLPPGFGGIFAGLVLAALVAAGFGARGLTALRAAAFGAAALGKGCLFGAPSNVPDLRGASA